MPLSQVTLKLASGLRHICTHLVQLGSYSPSQSSYTVHSHTAARILTEFVLQQGQPVIHYFSRWRSPVIKGPILQERERTSYSLICFGKHKTYLYPSIYQLEPYSKQCHFKLEIRASQFTLVMIIPSFALSLTVMRIQKTTQCLFTI